LFEEGEIQEEGGKGITRCEKGGDHFLLMKEKGAK